MRPVIMCGGVGTKMWPESNPQHPKQFLPLFKGKSLFELNWDALRKKFKPEEIYIQTNALQAEIAKRIVSEVVVENIFIEPEMRNHGPATGLAAALLVKQGLGDEPFILIQADLIRTPDSEFLAMIDLFDKMARETDKYITGGFTPDRVVAGVDYLVEGDKVFEEGSTKLCNVADYVDRKEEVKINGLMSKGTLLMHTNHTCMTPNNFLKMYKKYRDDWYQPLIRITQGASVEDEYKNMPKGPIEEVTVNVYRNEEALVCKYGFECVDFGTWDSVDTYLSKVQVDNNNAEKQFEIDSEGNFVRSYKPVALIGVDDLIVVNSPDGLLVAKKGQSGKVGEVVEKIKELG